MLTRLYAAASIPARPLGLGLWLLVGTGAVGCGSALSGPAPAAPIPPPRAASLDEVLGAYEAFCQGVETLSASGDLEVRDLRSGKSQRLGLRVVAARDGRLYLKGSVAIVTALEVVSDGARFWFQVPSKKTVWTGSASASPGSERGEAPYYVLRPRDITQALVPEPLAPGEGDSLVLEADRDSFSLVLARVGQGRGVASRRVFLDRRTLRPTRARRFTEAGDLVWDVAYSAYRDDGRPRQVVVTRPGDGYVASFSLDELQANVTPPARAFGPRTPEGYKIVEVP